MTFRPRITRVLLGINLMIMVLPLAGIGVLRLYENTLVRQTETELIAQAAFIAATYRAFIKQNIADVPEHYGLSITPAWQPAYQADKRWRPQPGILDLATDDIHPTPKDARLTENVADQPAITVGALLTPILQDAQTTTLAAIRVTNHQGIVVASTGSEIALSLQHRIEIQRALQGETVRLLRQRISDEPSPPLLSISRGAKVRVFIAMPIISDNKVIGSILLSRTPKTIMSTLHGKRHLLYSTIILLMLIVILLSVFTAKTISRPMKALMTQANLAKQGKLDAITPLTSPGTIEMDELSKAVADMAKNLQDQTRYIRDFAAHLSHEFKTPITAIQGAVELLEEYAATISDSDRKQFLSNIKHDTERMNQLVHRLLELTHADIATNTGASCYLNDVLLTTINQAQLARRHITTITPAQGIRLAISEEALTAVLQTLVENTIQHTKDDTQIVISTQYSVTNPQLTLWVQDTGAAISPTNAKQMFTPFFTTGRVQGNTGLGLAIAKSLLTTYQATIRFSAEEKITTFIITIPLSD